MALPGANPADALKEITKELQDKFDEAGMGKVEEFVDSLDDLVDKIKKGPGELVKAAETQIAEFKDKIDKIVADPGSALPDGGNPLMVACATTYAKSVASKLGDVVNDCSDIASKMTEMSQGVTGPLQTVGDSLNEALGKMEDSVKALAKLPKLVSKEISGKDSPDDVAKINTDPMKKALAGGDIDGPMDTIMGLASKLTDVVSVISRGVAFLTEFLGTVGAKIKSAFDPPFPLCCLSGMQPDALKQMLDMVEKMANIDMNPIVETLQKASDQIGSIKVDVVKVPMNAFQESATGLIDKLDKTVQASKLASGGGMGMVKGLM